MRGKTGTAVFFFLLFNGLSAWGSNPCEIIDPNIHSEYTQIYHCTFLDLWRNFRTDSGNWIGDMENDATSFAPEVLFDLYKITGSEIYYKKAMQTIEYEAVLLADFAKSIVKGQVPRETLAHIVSGLNSVITCVEKAKLPEQVGCATVLKPVLKRLLIGLSSYTLDYFFKKIPDYDRYWVTFNSRLAYATSRYYLARGARSKDKPLLWLAERIMSKLEDRGTKDERGFIKNRPEDAQIDSYDQANLLIAYTYLLKATHKEEYISKIDSLVRQLDQHFAVQMNGRSVGYSWQSPSMEDDYIIFSTQVQFLDAFVELASATGQRTYFLHATRLLEFIKDSMYLAPQGAVPDEWLNTIREIPHYSHDVRFHDGQIYVSNRYCVGCSFYFLTVLRKYSDLLSQRIGN